MAQRAATLAIRPGLRGHDSVHQIAALAVQDALAGSEAMTPEDACPTISFTLRVAERTPWVPSASGFPKTLSAS
jgi:hypothetical protein